MRLPSALPGHRAAPGDGGARLDELADRKHADPPGADGDDLAVGELRPLVIAHDPGLARP
jgi:hypothetical protein